MNEPPFHAIERELVARGPFILPLEGKAGVLEWVFKVTPTPAQQALYATLFDHAPVANGEMERALFGEFTGPVPDLARLTSVNVKGARIGGTRFGALAGVQRGFAVTADALAPGEPIYVVFIAPDTRLSAQALNFARLALHASPGLAECIVSDGAEQIKCMRPDGRQLIFRTLPASASGTTLRGRWYAWVQFVEGAHFHDADYAVNDADLYGAAKVRIVPGGMILIESTPWVESGLMFELFRDNFGRPRTAMIARAPTRLLRTDDPAMLATIDAEFERDSENAAQEYGAVFLSAGVGIFFDSRAIDNCVDESLPVDAPRGRSSAGADWGFESDSCALALAWTEEASVCVGSLDEEQPKPGAPLAPGDVVGNFAVTLKDRACASVMSDAHYRQSVIEHLTPHGLVLDDAPTGQEGNAAVWLKVRELVNSKRLRLPRHQRLIAQLKAVRSRPRPGGGLQIILPRKGKNSGHCDLAVAMALAVWQASADGYDYGKALEGLVGF